MRCKAVADGSPARLGMSVGVATRPQWCTRRCPIPRLAEAHTSALPIAAIVARCTHRSLAMQAVQGRDAICEPILAVSGEAG